MPRFEITAPDGRKFEITAPDGASKEDALAYAQKQFKPVEPHKPVSPTDDMGAGSRVLAGFGKSFDDVWQGGKQMLGLASQQEIDEKKRVDAPLMDTAGGVTGNVLGTIAAGVVPSLLLPSVGGAAAVGGALAGLQPTERGESRLQNAATGAALGGATQWGAGKLAKLGMDKLAASKAQAALQQSQNAVKDATLKASQEAGYVVPPSQSGGGTVARVLEGISGKYKTNQAAAIKNQNVTDRLARRAVGLADDAPITAEAMQGVRKEAFERGYTPVAKAGAIETDRVFQKALDDVVADYQGAARSFPGAVRNDVFERVDSLRTGVMDTGDALKMTQILRDEASKAYAAGDKALGKATRKASDAIEDQIERALDAAGKEGKELLKNFREARKLMAKSHSVERALVAEGGVVNSKVLGAMLQRGKPLSDELKTIGAFANNFKDVAGVPQSGWANPITALDAFGAAGMAGMGAGPFSVALPAARVAARSAVLSKPMQGSPKYGPGLLQSLPPQALEELEKRGLMGLLGSAYAAQK